jgi:hypothetical protein
MWTAVVTCAAFMSCGLTGAWESKHPQPTVEDCRATAELVLKFAGEEPSDFKVDCAKLDYWPAASAPAKK